MNPCILYIWPKMGTIHLDDPDNGKKERVSIKIGKVLPIYAVMEHLSAALKSKNDDVLYVIEMGGE